MGHIPSGILREVAEIDEVELGEYLSSSTASSASSSRLIEVGDTREVGGVDARGASELLLRSMAAASLSECLRDRSASSIHDHELLSMSARASVSSSRKLKL